MRAEGTFRGRLPSFADVRALAEAFGTAAGADHGTTLRVVLLLEELFTNTVTHGYADAGEGLVWVTLALGTGVIEITYEDAGPAFDPLTGAPAIRARPRRTRGARPGPGPGPQHVGAYARIGHRNRITLTVATGARRPPRPEPDARGGPSSRGAEGGAGSGVGGRGRRHRGSSRRGGGVAARGARRAG